MLCLLIVVAVVCWWFHFDGSKWIFCIELFPFIVGIGWHHSIQTERLLFEFIILCDISCISRMYALECDCSLCFIFLVYLVSSSFFFLNSFCSIISISIFFDFLFFYRFFLNQRVHITIYVPFFVTVVVVIYDSLLSISKTLFFHIEKIHITLALNLKWFQNIDDEGYQFNCLKMSSIARWVMM